MRNQEPVNKNATNEAKKLLSYLCEIEGNGIISGQHTQTKPMEETCYIAEHTGKTPKLYGFEMLAYSPNINYSDMTSPCLKEILENRQTMQTAIKMGLEGKIVTLSFHWYSPLGGRDKSFYAENTDFDPSKVLVEGTPERNAFY
nr:glycoside hydrolase family 26 protein [Lachnospiraceae bacterium]